MIRATTLSTMKTLDRTRSVLSLPSMTIDARKAQNAARPAASARDITPSDALARRRRSASSHRSTPGVRLEYAMR